MPIVIRTALLSVALAGIANATQLDPVFLASNLWSMPPARFMEIGAGSAGFRWVSDRHEAARTAAPGLTFLGLPVFEAVARWSDAGLTEVDISFFNRGDARDESEAAFNERIRSVTQSLEKLAGRARDVTPSAPARAGLTVRIQLWEAGPTYYRLEHARSRRRADQFGAYIIQPEYISLSLRPRIGTSPSDLRGPTRSDVSRSDLRRRVRRDSGGDLLLDAVPMVDQGQKGYCAVAATERIMRYYGLDVDQHALAQQASTASGGGTDPEALKRALHSMVSRLRLNLYSIESFTMSDLTRLVGDYNRVARKQRLPELVLPTSGMIDMNSLYGRMDRSLFISARTRSPPSVDRFRDRIQEKLAAGVPLVWGVVLGFVPENPPLPQAAGGHLRLIIGINVKANEVLYSDSWGAGHELKRMKMADAYAITTCLFTIELQ